MLCVLPLLSWYAWLRIFRRDFPQWRERFLVASVWWTLSLILITELLSGFDAICRDTIAIAWCGAAVIIFAADFLRDRLRRERGENASKPDAAYSWKNFRKTDWFLLGSSVAILALTGVTAIVAPPSGWDETLQHLPRVMQWLAQGSVGLFPTNYYVQDFAPPLTEWTMLHLLLLQGSDRFVNLVQWFGSLGSALAVSLIAEEFGCAIRGQLLSALLCLTIPQGILGASGAKNDWLVAFWLAVAAFLILRWQREQRWLIVMTLGIALGALILTKGTGYVFGLPIAVALLFVTPRNAWRKLAPACLLAASIMVLLNIPQWAQNDRLGHSVFGLPSPDVQGKLKYRANRITPATVAANVLRESSIHFGTPFVAVNRRMTAVVRDAVHVIGVDPDDPGLIRPGPTFAIPQYSLDEYLAGNPLQVVLAVACFAIVLFSIRTMSAEAALALGIIAAFVLYCAMFKWEIWAGRLHLGLFVLACPIIAVIVSKYYPKATFSLALLLLCVAMPPLLFNSTRPLFSSNVIRTMLHRPPDPTSKSILFRSRDEMYFGESTGLEPSYLPTGEAARKLSCTHIGLDTTDRPFAYEYILMGIIDDGGAPRKFRYLKVKNLTSRFTSKIDRQPPCAVLCIDCQHDPAKLAGYSSALPNVEQFGSVVLFSPSIQ
ncbi:MAG TPA: glycosyltransferase family 39 protein [Acidobacteriaceae bacterium]|nr:glycosyltransferase family 39 protein [Acidobacteriaceae bacterium]